MTNSQKTHPLHIHKWDSFLSVIFEDAALRVGDIVRHPELGEGRVTRRFLSGMTGQFCAHFDSVGGEQMLRTENLELEEDGTFSHCGFFHGNDKRISHDKELRKLMKSVGR